VKDKMRDRLANPRLYERWREQVAKAETGAPTIRGPVYSNDARVLGSRLHAYFWAERLIYPAGDTLASLAADQLIAIGSPVAREALTLAASDVRQNRLLVEKVSRALVQRGDAASLARIMAARRGAGDTPEMQRLVLATLEDLAPDSRAKNERTLLDTLGKESSRDLQIATLEVLSKIGGAPSLERLIALRRAVPDDDVKAAADGAISRIAAREGLTPAAPEPQSDSENLREEYERQWREEYDGKL
jgi:hypothetical protein